MLSRVLFRHAEVEGIVVELLTSALPVSILGLWLGNTKTTSITVSVQELNENSTAVEWGQTLVTVPITIYTTYNDPSTLDPRIIGREIPSNSASTECFALAKRWLRTCSEGHDNCPGNINSSLPTRVIDLRPPTPYILQTNDMRGRYATLSHCWGPKETPPLTATTLTLKQRRQGLYPHELPRSFRDAIKIVRELDIDYLWIDSLCIIQDSQDDWAKESMKMADIYGNSFLTIAASRSPNSHSGIFSEREAGQTSAALAYKSKYMAEEGKIYLRPPITAYIPGEEVDQAYNLEDKIFVEPLFTRAWVLQERILSKRTINFGTGELMWECQTTTAHESMTAFPERLQAAEMKRAFVPQQSRDNLAVESKTPTELGSIYTRWFTILEAYTRLHLTYESDKLPALSGLAREFYRQTGDEYLAGLWKADFNRALLWRPSGVDHDDYLHHFIRRRPKDWRAPSWSWASWDGPMNASLAMYSSRVSYDHDAKFLDIQVRPENDSSMERLKYGFMKVRGLSATVGLGKRGFAASWLTYKGIQLDVYGPCALLDQQSQPDQYGRTPPKVGSLFACLQIGIWNEHHPSSDFHCHKNDTIYCLLLLQGLESSCYQRVGIAWLRTDSGNVRDAAAARWELEDFMIE